MHGQTIQSIPNKSIFRENPTLYNRSRKDLRSHLVSRGFMKSVQNRIRYFGRIVSGLTNIQMTTMTSSHESDEVVIQSSIQSFFLDKVIQNRGIVAIYFRRKGDLFRYWRIPVLCLTYQRKLLSITKISIFDLNESLYEHSNKK